MNQESQVYGPRDVLDWNLKFETISLLRDALEIYEKELQSMNREGASRIQAEIEFVGLAYRSINNQLRSHQRQDPDHYKWGANSYRFEAQQFSLFKAVLPLVLEQVEHEREKRVAQGEPALAMEDLDSKKALIEEIFSLSVFQEVEARELIRKAAPSKVSDDGSVVIHATIYNRDGIVAVGRDIKIQQSYSTVGKLIEEFIQAANNSDELDSEEKEELSAHASTIQAQLTTKKPHSGIITAAWKVIKGIVTTESLLQFTERIGPLLSPLLIEKALSP